MSTNKPLISLLVTEPFEGTWDTISEIPLSARIASTYRFSAQVTEFPVEAGGKITDHVHIKPDAIDLEGFVSDSPIKDAPTTLPTMKGDEDQQAPWGPSQSAYDALLDVFQKRALLTIVTELMIFEDMVVTDLQFPRSRDRGEGLWFTLQARKIATVETLTATLPPEVVSKLKRRRKKTAAKRKANAKVNKFIAQKAKEYEIGKITEKEADDQSAAYAKSNGVKYTSSFGKTR